MGNDAEAQRRKRDRDRAAGKQADRSPWPGEEWRADAACAGADTSLWYSYELVLVAAAQAVCAGCPVRSDCLTDAVNREEEHGMWGGVEERELRRMVRQRRRARAS